MLSPVQWRTGFSQLMNTLRPMCNIIKSIEFSYQDNNTVNNHIKRVVWRPHLMYMYISTFCWYTRQQTSAVTWLCDGPMFIATHTVLQTIHLCRLSTWLSGRTSVSGQRSFAVLRSTCSGWVTTYVGKPSAIGQPTRPTQPFILSGSINE